MSEELEKLRNAARKVEQVRFSLYGLAAASNEAVSGFLLDSANDLDQAEQIISQVFNELTAPEQPQDTDSTETMAEAAAIVDADELVKRQIIDTDGLTAVQPMTDLSGVDYAPAFEGYQPNGSLPETD